MADRPPDTTTHADQGRPARPRTDDPEVPEADALEQSEEWVPGGGDRRLPADPEVPEADALEQSEEWVPGGGRHRLPTDPEVPEADAWEQSQEVPFDDEEPA